MANFNDSLQIVLRHEGGYATSAVDGGEVKYGISKKQYPHLDIEQLSLEQATQIYFEDYWSRFRINEISRQKIADAVMDAVVHHGKGIMIIQKALNRAGKPVKVDNLIGPETIMALNNVPETAFLQAYVNERKTYMNEVIADNPALEQYRAGWFKRVDFFLPGGAAASSKIALALMAGIAAFWLFGRGR